MDNNWIEFGLAATLAVLAITFVIWFLKYKASRSERRMFDMLQRAGVDSETIRDGDHEAIMEAVRKRCQACQAEDVCERWLAGSYSEDNLFCPNAQIFRQLAAEHKQVSLIYD